MAIRFTYPVKSTLSGGDLILITDSQDSNKTKQVSASTFPGFSGVGIETLGVSGSSQSGAAQTLAVETGNTFLTISSATNTHTFGMSGALPLANGGTGLTTASGLTPGHTLQVNAAGTALQYAKVSLPVRSKNTSGATIKKGAPVFVSGLDSSGEPIISKFYADSSNAENITPLGLLVGDSATGGDVEVISSGLIENFDFSEVNGTKSVGAKVYLTPQSGEGSGLALTTVKPTSGIDISLGTIIDPSNNGSLLVTASGGEAVELPNANAVGSLLYSDSTNQFIELGIGAANKVLTVNSAGNAPEWSTINTGVTTVNFGTTGLTPNTNASGAITVAGVLGTANGGTNRTSYTAGDLLYASTSSVLSSVAIGSAGQFLQVNNLGTAPQWGGGPSSYSTITGTASNITTSSANSTAVFAVNTDTSMTITGNGVSNLAWGLGVPSSTKKGGVKAEQGPTSVPTQSSTGTWLPVDFVQADNSKLAVKVPDAASSDPNGLLLHSNSFRGTSVSQLAPPQFICPEITTTTSPLHQVEFDPTATGTGSTGRKVFGKCSRPTTGTDYVRVEANLFLKHEDNDGSPDNVRVFAGLHHTSGNIAPQTMTYGWQMSGYTDSDDINRDIGIYRFAWDILVSDILDTNGSAASAGGNCYFFLKMASRGDVLSNPPTVIFGQYWKADFDTVTGNSLHAAGPVTMDVYEIKSSSYNNNPLSPV